MLIEYVLRKNVFVVAWWMFVIMLLLSVSGCGKGSQGKKQPRLVLLYSTCTVNKRYLSPYNHTIKFTPNFEKFSKISSVFTKHRTEASLSGVAFASIFTGNQAPVHGAFTHATKLADDQYEITEAFGDNGYDTYVWGGHPMASIDLNYAQVSPKEENPFRANKRLEAGDDDFVNLLAQLKEDSSKRAFAMTNFTVTHGPYQLNAPLDLFCADYPSECLVRKKMAVADFDNYVKIYAENHRFFNYNFPGAVEELDLSQEEIQQLASVVELLYKATIYKLDSMFGEVVSAIERAGLLQESLIVFTADHGESLYNKGVPFKWSHGHALQAGALDVPLLIFSANKDLKQGEQNFVTRSIDLFPTLVGMAALQMPQNWQVSGINLAKYGQENGSESLLAFSHSSRLPGAFVRQVTKDGKIVSLISDKKEFGYLARFYPESTVYDTWVAVRDKDMVFKWRKDVSGEFIFSAFDLSKDPDELVSVFDQKNSYHAKMAQYLIKYKDELIAGEEHRAGRVKKVGADKTHLKKEIKKLRTLGYIP